VQHAMLLSIASLRGMVNLSFFIFKR